MADISPLDCKHCHCIGWNEIGEDIAYCEVWAEWKNVTLGDCIGNCESEERQEDDRNG